MSFLTVCLNPTLQKTLRFSSIAPGEVNRTAVHRLDVSGKGINVTRVLTQLGKNAAHLTQLGGELRPLFLSLCEQDGLSVEWVESKSPIRFCYTILTDGAVTELVEESQAVSEGTEERLLEKFDSLLYERTFSWLIVSGTKAAGFSDAVIPTMVRKAKQKGLKVILDIRGKDLIESLQYRPEIIKPNLFEFTDTFACFTTCGSCGEALGENAKQAAAQEQIKSVMLDVSKKYGSRIILTDGSHKLRVVDGESYFEIDFSPVTAINTTGCGDAFTAGLVSAMEDGADFYAAITEGVRCGALNAALIKPGVIEQESAKSY